MGQCFPHVIRYSGTETHPFGLFSHPDKVIYKLQGWYRPVNKSII